MGNNGKFNNILNRCKHPRKVYNVLAAIAAQEARETFPERFTGRTDQEIINEIASVVQQAEKEGIRK